MDKGQHLRLAIVPSPASDLVIALATDLAVHFSATTEDSTTKDSTDASTGVNWNEYDVTQRSADIQFGALLGVGEDEDAKTFADWVDGIDDELINWKLCFASGEENRTLGKTVCSGTGKLTSLQANATNRQKATYSGTLTVVGAVTVGTD